VIPRVPSSPASDWMPNEPWDVMLVLCWKFASWWMLLWLAFS
jgi:hypothetical protein